MFHYLMITVVLGALVASAIGIGNGIRASRQPDPLMATVRLVSDGSEVSGASSKLVRTDDTADYEFSTSNPPVGHIVTLRALVFNQPGACTHGDGRRRCSQEDLSNPDVNGSVILLTSSLLRGKSAFNAKGTVSAGKPEQLISGEGLTNPRGADVQLILMDHGVPAANLFGPMLSTLRGGCTDAGPGEGDPGPIACSDLAIAAHEHK